MNKKLILITALLCLITFSDSFANVSQVKGAIKPNPQDNLKSQLVKKQTDALFISFRINQLYRAPVLNKALIDSLSQNMDNLMGEIDSIKSKMTDGDEPGSKEVLSLPLSISTLVFGLLLIISVLTLQAFNKEHSIFQTYKIVGIMFIGTISVFLIPAGYDSQQITPVVGLLGTLAGYLVGTSQGSGSQDRNGASGNPQNSSQGSTP